MGRKKSFTSLNTLVLPVYSIGGSNHQIKSLALYQLSIQ